MSEYELTAQERDDAIARAENLRRVLCGRIGTSDYRDAPIEDVMAEVDRQVTKWRSTLDWLAER